MINRRFFSFDNDLSHLCLEHHLPEVETISAGVENQNQWAQQNKGSQIFYSIHTGVRWLNRFGLINDSNNPCNRDQNDGNSEEIHVENHDEDDILQFHDKLVQIDKSLIIFSHHQGHW